MKSFKTVQFTKLLANLPNEIQKIARKNYQLLKADNKYPGLNFQTNYCNDYYFYTVRLGLYHKALGVKKGQIIIWFWKGSQEDDNNMFNQI